MVLILLARNIYLSWALLCVFSTHEIFIRVSLHHNTACSQGRHENPFVDGKCKAEFTLIFLDSKLFYYHQSLFIQMS